MTAAPDLKQEVRAFYDSIGWKEVGEGVYQNARYEDLRPVSREYIRRCHLRVGRYIPQRGRYLLDAGSGPIQYPEYLTYSAGYRYRVCLDISITALQEARSRISDHGLYVVGDVARPPFRREAFEAIVSLHTIHHLPADEQRRAFFQLLRTLRRGGRAAVVYSWGENALLTRVLQLPTRMASKTIRLYRRIRRRLQGEGAAEHAAGARESGTGPVSTFTHKHGYAWARRALADLPGFEIRVWRSVSTPFLRAFMHAPLLGRFWLRLLYALEERAPHLLGRIGQYPMILFARPAAAAEERLE